MYICIYIYIYIYIHTYPTTIGIITIAVLGIISPRTIDIGICIGINQ